MNNKERYERPELGVIELKAEEVLATGCKTAIKPGPASPQCMLIPCSVSGS